MKTEPTKYPGMPDKAPIQNGNNKSGGVTNTARGKYGRNMAKAMKQKGK